jgi:hypothetical protein
VIPLVVTDKVREVIAPGLSKVAGDEAVLADLADGWTLTHTSESLRGRGNGALEVVNLIGRTYRYLARLPRYALPLGWCICPDESLTCRCREPGRELGSDAVILTRCDAIAESRYVALAGAHYYDRFVLRRGASATSGVVDPDWYETMEVRWTQTHARVRRLETENGIVGQWGRVLRLRRLVAESLSKAVAYRTVELDEQGLLVFELLDPAASVSLDGVYEVSGFGKTQLRVVENEGGQLRCESERNPVAVANYAEERRGRQRRLMLDPAATSAVLRREELAMGDLQAGRAHNPELLSFFREPSAARYDELLAVIDLPVQPQLDDAQRLAVEHALRARDLLIVQGPPGTGKTTFIAELIARHLRIHPGDTVLVASQTHQATDNLLRRVHALEPDLPIVRVAGEAQEEKIAEDIRRFWLDAAEPLESSVRTRAERYRRFVAAQLATGGMNPDTTGALLDVQREYLEAHGSQPSRERRLADARVIAGTCYGVSSDPLVREGNYTLAVLEEAGKASPSEALMAMLRAEKAVLVGDSRQLPPTPDSALVSVLSQAHKNPEAIPNHDLRQRAVELAQELDQSRRQLLGEGREAPRTYTAETLFTYMGRRLRDDRPELEVTLRKQYRMVSGIGEMISACFYEHALEHGRSDDERDARASSLTEAHVRLVDVEGHENQPKGSNSYRNHAEAARAVRQLRSLEDAVVASEKGDGERLSVAVITGYAAQLRELKREIAPLESKLAHLTVRLGLVDRFQGDQAEVVLVSLVRTAKPGFLSERNRINVALSRARSLLIILADVPRARNGAIGRPIREVVSFIDAQTAERDRRYEIETHRKEGRA